MGLKNIVLTLGIGMVCIGTSLLFVNGQKSSELSDAEIKKRAEMLGMIEPNKDAILTSELENLKNNEGDAEDTENIEKKEMNGQQEDLQDNNNQKTENNQEIENKDKEKEIEKNSNKNTSKKEKESAENADKNTSIKKDAESEKTSNKTNKASSNKISNGKTSSNKTSNDKGLDNNILNEETSKKENTKKANNSKKNKKNVKKEDTNKNDEKQQEIEDKNTTIVKINSGMTAGEICRKLQEEGLIEDAEDFRQYLVDKNIQRKLQAGTFEIINGADYDEILGSIYKG